MGVRVSAQVVELERLPVGRVVFVDLKMKSKEDAFVIQR